MQNVGLGEVTAVVISTDTRGYLHMKRTLVH